MPVVCLFVLDTFLFRGRSPTSIHRTSLILVLLVAIRKLLRSTANGPFVGEMLTNSAFLVEWAADFLCGPSESSLFYLFISRRLGLRYIDEAHQ